MKKKFSLLLILGVFLITVLFLTGCPNPAGDGSSDKPSGDNPSGVGTTQTYTSTSGGTTYKLVITERTSSISKAVRYAGKAGDSYTLTITPPGLTSTGTVESVEGGKLTLKPSKSGAEVFVVTISGEQMTAIIGTITPNEGEPVVAPTTPLTPIASSDSTLTAEEHKAIAEKAMEEGRWVDALDSYEAAYQAGSEDTETVVYSTVNKLASIASSPAVGNLFRNIGITGYPTTLSGLVNISDWFVEYYERGGYGTSVSNPGTAPPVPTAPASSKSIVVLSSQSSLAAKVYLPPIASPPKWLEDKDSYKDNLGPGQIVDSANWGLILIAHFIDYYGQGGRDGLNSILDDVIDAVFGTTFNEAVRRTALLKGKDPVKLPEGLIQDFGLEDIFGTDGVYIGWAELELLIDSLRIVKATLEYVASYNWELDLNIVKNLPWEEEAAKDALEKLSADDLNKILPLRTKFMTARTDKDYMAKSRADYTAAAASIIGVYDYYTGGSSKIPTAFKDELERARWARDALNQLKTAITGGAIFYVQDLQVLYNKRGSTYDNTTSGALFGINFGKFFTSGQLSLDKLIETTGTGSAKIPTLYGFKYDVGTQNITTSGTKINDFADIRNYNEWGFKFQSGPVEEILPLTTGDFKDMLGWFDSARYCIQDQDIAELLWTLYHKK
jgi:hypothetical protein